MSDTIRHSWLTRQFEEGTALARTSDRITILPMGEPAPEAYVVTFSCAGLIQRPDHSITEAHQFTIGIAFGPEYLRRVDPFNTLAWLGPRNIWHPNISNQAPVICVGRIVPGTPLVDLIYQTYELITYVKYTLHDVLNPAAAAWARQNLHRFPVDKRPLKRRPVSPGQLPGAFGGAP